MNVLIYEFDNLFSVYDTEGRLIRKDFTNKGEAVIFCKKNNLNILDIWFAVT